MTKNEIEVFNIIRENDNPEQALLIAIKVFSSFVEKLEVAQLLQAEGLQESS